MLAGLCFFSKASGYTPLNLLVSAKMTRMTKIQTWGMNKVANKDNLYHEIHTTAEPCISNIHRTNYLTPWMRDHLEKLAGSQVVKQFPAYYGTQRFITTFTRACHLSLF
jgi:hypothetical protein